MAIIGKFIKKSTAIGFKRNAKKNSEYKNQLSSLCALLELAKITKFGMVHSFHAILKNTDVVSQFQKNVPITNYEEFYDKWLKQTLQGAKNHTWKGKIKYFALSSGTTGSPSKRLPISIEMIRSFQKTSINQLTLLHELNLPESFFSASVLTVGGSIELTKKDKHIEGDLSGILKKHTTLLATPFTKPGNRISRIKNWDEKIKAIIEKAPKWNIGIIAGIPSWCILLMEEIVEHYQLTSIHDIWPNLSIYVHGGVFMDPYISRLNKLTKSNVILMNTYLASEGYFAYQENPRSNGMKLLLSNGIFYEFIPFNSTYFDENGELLNKHNAYTINEVQKDVDYALVISTNAGLWRYLIGDLVRFENITKREIRITGRIKQFLSLCGEHLSLDNIYQALLSISDSFQISISEFTIYADIENQCHHWFLGIDEEVNQNELLRNLDKNLSSINDDYAYVRKYNLNTPIISIIKTSKFHEFLASQGKKGSQNKMARVLNEQQKADWIKFING
jgi:phenylacetate-coenzyme A ligase PaaK-like adenylate-forming protein